jgi:hypothetical protein
VGPGEGVGEGIFAIGAYGSLGEPSVEHGEVAAKIADHLRARGRMQETQIFVYAIDEACDSPWPAKWLDLVARADAMHGVRVGATCGRDPLEQRADLVMMTAPDYVPERARAARKAGKWVWVYNGQRPFAGPMMLDAPAVDLRANAWIAARYGVDRWFYWESTYWLDDNRGGRGGKDGFDPFVVAETFHNADGDWANGDGVLLYPGTQAAKGMTDFGQRTVFPSVRLKNVRRGVEDVAYIEAARQIDREAADAVVRRVVPSALAHAGKRAAWPERGATFLDARRDLARIFERAKDPARPEPVREARGGSGLTAGIVLAASAIGVLFMTRRVRRRRR